jgi:MFS family permease
MKKYKQLLFSSLGASFEYYDLAIYYVFAVTIGNRFFGTDSASENILLVSLTYLTGYLSRPIGAWLLGCLADRKGRVYVLRLNMMVLFFTTLSLGLLPSVETLGVLSTILFVGIRLIQAVVIGSEIPISVIYVMDNYPNRRGLVVSVVSFCLSLGILGTSIVYFLLSHYTSSSFLDQYGWRIGFLIGALFTLLLFFFRRGIADVSDLDRSKNNHEIKEYSFIPKVMLGATLVAFIAMIYSQVFVFLPSYCAVYLGSSKDISNLLLFGSLAMTIACPIGGFVSDYVSRLKMLSVIVILCMVISPAFYYNLIHGGSIYPYFILLSFIIGLFAPTYYVIIADFFILTKKCSGLGLSYNLGYMFFASTIPSLTVVLVGWTGSLYVPIYMILFAGVVTLSGVLVTTAIKKKA